MKQKFMILAAVSAALLTHAAQPNPRQGRAAVRYHAAAKSPNASAAQNLLAYVVTVGFQFGAIDLSSGAFLPIGPGLPTDVGTGLVPGHGSSLLSLAFNGDLVSIDPATGLTTVVGPTGLGDCTTPESACGPNSASVIGNSGGRLFVTDFANNLYSVNPNTGKATLIGPTGLPPLTAIPFSMNPDGTFNVYSETLFGYRGKLYATFATLTINPETGEGTEVIPGELYEINPSTGQTTPIGPTPSNLTAAVVMKDTVYAFDAASGQIVILDVNTGHTTPVVEQSGPFLQPAVIAGATPARPVPDLGN